MNSTALEIAHKLKGSVEGDSNVILTTLSKIEDASEGSLSFLSNPKYIPFLKNTNASAVLVPNDLKINETLNATIIRVKNPYNDFTKLLTEISNEKKIDVSGIHPRAITGKNVTIGKNVYLGPNVIIDDNTIIKNDVHISSNCSIGDNVIIKEKTFIFSNVSILSKTEIGKNCIIHSGAVVGSDGFGFTKKNSVENIKIPHLGNVIVSDNVEIGANTTIDRATLGSTKIGYGVKLDNLVQIAHNVEIGELTMIAAQTGIAGSTKIGSRCEIGGQVGVGGHLILGDDIKIQGQTGVTRNIKSGSVIQGTPSLDFNSYYKSFALFKKLPDLYKRIIKLEKLWSYDYKKASAKNIIKRN